MNSSILKEGKGEIHVLSLYPNDNYEDVFDVEGGWDTHTHTQNATSVEEHHRKSKAVSKEEGYVQGDAEKILHALKEDPVLKLLVLNKLNLHDGENQKNEREGGIESPPHWQGKTMVTLSSPPPQDHMG